MKEEVIKKQTVGQKKQVAPKKSQVTEKKSTAEKKKVYRKYLPIGTVALLKGGKKRIMITGFCPAQEQEGKNVEYDYCGVIYPEGVISTTELLVFNHSQIARIYHVGLNDSEEKAFKEALLKYKKNN